MEKSRLLELFKSLDKVEVKKMRKWVRSPFFNQREDVILLFDYLDKNRPLEKRERLQRQYVFSQIFPNEPFDEKKFGYAQTFLMTEIKKFLAYQEFSENEIRPQIALVRSLRKKGVNKHFESEWKNVNTLLEKQPMRNAEYHFFNFQLYNEQYEYTNSISRKQPKGLQEASDELTNYFIAQKLKQGCDKLSHKSLIQADYQKDFIEKVIDFISEKEIFDSPSVEIYYQIYQTITKHNPEEYYFDLRKLLLKYKNQLPKSELKDMYVFAINFCIRQHNAGINEFKKELFELYKEGLESEVFIANGCLSRFTYKNIVSIGINLKEFNWVENFIHRFKMKIEEPWRESTFIFNLANMYHKKSEYIKAMKLLQKAEFTDVFLNINARKMMLKMYFELNEFEALESLLDSFTRYLNRQKNLGYHKDLHLDLIKVVRRLLQIPKFEKETINIFKEEIESTDGLIEKEWILNQCS